MVYDIVIIGAGVSGALIAHSLSAYALRLAVVDRNAEPAEGTSAANSGIVHAGYDAAPGSLKARLGVRGNAAMEQLCAKLDVPFRRIGSLVLALDEEDMQELRHLYDCGVQNGVPELALIGADEARAMEPSVVPSVCGALYAPTAGIVCPYELTTAALEVACAEGTDYLREFAVCGIARSGGVFTLTAADGRTIMARTVVNAAGLYADRIAAMAGDDSFTIKPRKGEYILFEKSLGTLVRHVIFQTPKHGSKGVLVSPTVDGNLFVGPNAHETQAREDVSTTPAGLEEIAGCARLSVDGIDLRRAITNFAGLRATPSTGDFVIGEPVPGFINVAGIELPGLSASPAIAEYVMQLLRTSGVRLTPKTGWTGARPPIVRFRELSFAERQSLVQAQPDFGRMVCRCETVTEAEIRAAIRRPAGARTVDGIKRRTRSGMGRCQGGFCSPRVMELLAEELGIPLEQVTKSGGASRILIGKLREVETNE